MKKTFIITGAAGFLGNNIIRKLNKQESEAEIRALVLPTESVVSLEGLNCEIFKGDITKPETLNEIFNVNDYDELYVIHCAAIVYLKSEYNPVVYEVNVNGTKNVVEKVLEKNAKMVYISSVHAIPENPNNEVMAEITDFNPDKVKGLYAKTKAEAAKYVLEMVKNKNLNACIVHPAGIVGPYDFGTNNMAKSIIEAANGNLKVCIEGGYNFVDVRDVAEGIIQACSKGQKGECYLLSNKYFSMEEIANMAMSKMGIGKVEKIMPMWKAKAGIALAEASYKAKNEEPPITKYSLDTLAANSNFTNEKAKRELGYSCRDMKDTVNDTVDWYIKQNRINKNCGR